MALSPQLLFAVLALSLGCATTAPSGDGGLAAAAPFADPRVLTAQVPPENGLLLEGRSSYDIERQLERLQTSRDDLQGQDLFLFFGTTDEYFVRDQVSDLHKHILPQLKKRVEASPLKHEKWNGAYRLSFNVFHLFVHSPQQAQVDWPQPVCNTEIGVTLHHIPTNTVVFRQTPNLQVMLKKATPGGKQTLKALHAQAAEAIYQSLADNWAESGTVSPTE